MDKTYNEFEGTDLDLDADMDFDDDSNDLIPILGLSAAVAAVVGAILVLAGRRRKPTTKERIQDMFEDLGKEGSKRAKTVTRAVGKVDLGEMLGDAIAMARSAADDFDMGDTMKDVRKRARKMSKDVDLSSMLEDALERTRDAAEYARHRADEGATFARHRADDARKSASKVTANLSMPDVDGKDVGNFLETLRDKVAEVLDTVRSEAAPKAADAVKENVIPAAQSAADTVARTVREDVMPAAQDVLERMRDDVLPEVQKRAGKLIGDAELGKRSRTVGRAAGQGAGTLAEMARSLAMGVAERVMHEYLPGAQKAGGKAAGTMLEDFLPAVGRRAGRAAGKVGDVAQQTPGALSDLLGTARDKAQDALDKVGPMAADAATFGRHRADDAATFARHRADEALTFGRHRLGDAASVVGERRNGVTKSVSKGASRAGHGVKGVVGGAVGATTSFTRETTRIFFWLSLLGGIILMAFVPDKERQREIINNAFQFLGEVREMWTDLQGPDDEPDMATPS
jgi:uncharacterized protein YjbJ (UPF0337 family)